MGVASSNVFVLDCDQLMTFDVDLIQEQICFIVYGFVTFEEYA